MERLTARRCNGIKNGYWTVHSKEEVVQRLGAYEDFGLSPEELRKVFSREAVLKLAAQIFELEGEA